MSKACSGPSLARLCRTQIVGTLGLVSNNSTRRDELLDVDMDVIRLGFPNGAAAEPASGWAVDPLKKRLGRSSSFGFWGSSKAWDWPPAGHWKHPGTEKSEGALHAEALRCILSICREIKAEVPAQDKLEFNRTYKANRVA